MKPMLDKDFDAFFKSSFEDFEVVPATDSWTNISEKIKQKPKRISFQIFWMAAASIVIVLGIGIGLYTKPTEVIKLRPSGENEMMADLAKEQNATLNVYEAPKPVTKTIKNPGLKPVHHKMSSQLVSSNLLTPSKLKPVHHKMSSEESVSIAVEESPVVKTPITTDLTSVRNVKSVRPKLVAEQLLAQEEIMDLKKAKAVSLNENSNPFFSKISTADPVSTKKLKISSVGDLVNFVVAKVDKREDKIIKMSRTAESDNEITGINLGIVKFNKKD
ncbi:MAG TPA: hypothetical protein VFM79_11555 [Pelobium sp.]|nr:hypothetical protein [Pelobium sp.]